MGVKRTATFLTSQGKQANAAHIFKLIFIMSFICISHGKLAQAPAIKQQRNVLHKRKLLFLS